MREIERDIFDIIDRETEKPKYGDIFTEMRTETKDNDSDRDRDGHKNVNKNIQKYTDKDRREIETEMGTGHI